MGTSIRKVADVVRQPDPDSGDENPVPVPDFERDPRLGDRLRGTLSDVSVDSVKSVREIRERE